jgi:hypothetical protein
MVLSLGKMLEIVQLSENGFSEGSSTDLINRTAGLTRVVEILDLSLRSRVPNVACKPVDI